MALFTIVQTSCTLHELNRWESDDFIQLLDILRHAGENEVADKLVFLRMCGKLSKAKLELVAYSEIHPRSRFVLLMSKPNAKQGARYMCVPRKRGKKDHELKPFPRKKRKILDTEEVS
jgi:hypothetical protein